MKLTERNEVNAVLVEAVQLLVQLADGQAGAGDLRDEGDPREPV